MKTFLPAFFAVFLFSFTGLAQVNSIKDYPLKDYVAPEIQYRLMNLGTWMNSQGGNDFDQKKSQNSFNTNLWLSYYEYLNMAKVQRTEISRLDTRYASIMNKNDSIKQSSSYLSFRFNYLTQTRLYRKNNTFWGIHGNLEYNLSPTTQKETSRENIKRSSQYFVITPYLSFGKGRIEPIESARQAVDILLSLQKHGRLSVSPNKSLIDSLARVANRIRYKRFFDFRFKTIYQLEELDKALQGMGLVDTIDMVYFANLNDIWNYARTYKRGTGTRFEGGIIPAFYANLGKTDDPNVSAKTKNNTMNYGLYGFFSLNRMRPVSYAWQSDLMLDLTFGYDKEIRKYEQNDEVEKTETEYLRSMLNASWQFGFFPNTRTYAGITPYAGLTFTSEKDADNTFGVNTGFRFDSYYYISPRLRISLRAGFYYAHNFDDKVPTPFWNTVSYIGQSVQHLRETNDNVPFPTEATTGLVNGIAYDFSFSLTYALF